MSIGSDYIPLNPSTIQSGQYFGIHSYSISSRSHTHHLEYLKTGNPNCFYHFNSDVLFPFEMFPLPRVLSSLGGYKKINEIISIQGERKISKFPRADELLCADVKVDKIFRKNGIVFGYFTSTTKNKEGDLLMVSIDKAILLNQTDKSKFRQIIKIKEKTVPTLKIENSVQRINNTSLHFRHNWDDKIWLNNIHTDSYARILGYKRGLIEAPCFVDLLLTNQNTGMLLKDGVTLSWSYFAPLYHGLPTNIFLEKKQDSHIVHVCDVHDNSILMSLKIKSVK